MDVMDDLDGMDDRGDKGDKGGRWDLGDLVGAIGTADTVDGAGLDHRVLSALRARGADPRVASVARGLSLAGEHGALWLAAGLAGAAADGARRGPWLRATALVAGAHLASMGVKRVVRRARPAHVHPLVRTAGQYSFPSSHAASATAAAVAFGTLGAYGAAPLAAAVCLSRLVAGVHYPADVAAGAALGALTARLGTRWVNRGTAGDGGRP